MLCGNHVKITDFEYAKKMTLPGKRKVHETRTVKQIFEFYAWSGITNFYRVRKTSWQ